MCKSSIFFFLKKSSKLLIENKRPTWPVQEIYQISTCRSLISLVFTCSFYLSEFIHYITPKVGWWGFSSSRHGSKIFFFVEGKTKLKRKLQNNHDESKPESAKGWSSPDTQFFSIYVFLNDLTLAKMRKNKRKYYIASLDLTTSILLRKQTQD